jgi:hypothetical protein
MKIFTLNWKSEDKIPEEIFTNDANVLKYTNNKAKEYSDLVFIDRNVVICKDNNYYAFVTEDYIIKNMNLVKQ